MNLNPVLSNPEFDVDTLEVLLEGHLEGSVEVVLVDPGYMRVLNSRYRHIDRSTDVLSFDLSPSDDKRPDGVIYVDGRLFPPYEALLERIFHGYLHLCGFSHESTIEAEQMQIRVSNMVSTAMKGRVNP